MEKIKVKIYDPSVKAYRDVSVDDYKKQLEALGLDKEEVQEKVEKAMKPTINYLKKVGVSKEEINKVIKEQTK